MLLIEATTTTNYCAEMENQIPSLVASRIDGAHAVGHKFPFIDWGNFSEDDDESPPHMSGKGREKNAQLHIINPAVVFCDLINKKKILPSDIVDVWRAFNEKRTNVSLLDNRLKIKSSRPLKWITAGDSIITYFNRCWWFQRFACNARSESHDE